MTRKLLLLIALVGGVVVPASAQRGAQAPDRRPEVFEAVVHCRGIAEPAARLQCFDAAAAALEQAAERRDVVVVDRSQVRETRRRLFGLALPRLPIFGGGDNDRDEPDISTLEGVVASAGQNGYGQWSVRLRDGSLWVQTDHNPLAMGARAGDPVVVHRGPLGSYMMRVGRQPGFRVRRQL